MDSYVAFCERFSQETLSSFLAEIRQPRLVVTLLDTGAESDREEDWTPIEAPGLGLFTLPAVPDGTRVTLGRGLEQDLVLVHDCVSRHHLSFLRLNNDWAVADAGSRNGATLNGRPLGAGYQFLRPQAELLLGHVIVLEFMQPRELFERVVRDCEPTAVASCVGDVEEGEDPFGWAKTGWLPE